jgi:hypothetical protein
MIRTDKEEYKELGLGLDREVRMLLGVQMGVGGRKRLIS